MTLGTAAVVALGSNLGDRGELIADAVAALGALPLTSLVAVADPQESVAVTLEGPDPNAPRYLNSVAILRTRLAPTVLLQALLAIENEHGRVRRDGIRWDDRTLDLDLIAYGTQHIDTADLTVPHPRAAERSFVLEPWHRIDRDAELPGRGRVDDLLRALPSGVLS